MLDKGQLNGFDVAAGSVPDGHRKEQFSSYSASSRITENASLSVQKNTDVAGSFGICHKELPEHPACGTFLSNPYFSYLGLILFKRKLEF